nr:Extra-large GTP-binding protein 3 [Ipomoea batatas]
MADLASLENARKQLEDLYLGVPDESVNLTFQHLLVQPPPTSTPSGDQKSSNHSEHPILDFHPEPPNNPHVINAAPGDKLTCRGHHHATPERGSRRAVGLVERNNKYEKEDMSYVSGVSSILVMEGTIEVAQVCGRVYCRHCMRIGMGDMTEGRKCLDCLGRRFSPRTSSFSPAAVDGGRGAAPGSGTGGLCRLIRRRMQRTMAFTATTSSSAPSRDARTTTMALSSLGSSV